MADLTAIASDLTALRKALLTAGSLDGASLSSIQAVVANVANAINSVGTAVGIVETAMAAATGSGNVVAGVSASDNVSAFNTYLAAALQAPDLVDMSAFLDRMQANIFREIGQQHGPWLGVEIQVPS